MNGMTSNKVWEPLRIELARWQDAGRKARFWLRDDDAVEPTPALEKLLQITSATSTPLTLAVIPATTGNALADRLAAESACAVALHGWSHTNHASANEKKQELGSHRPASAVLGELAEGFGKLKMLHRKRFVPILVPPWNRISSALLPALPGIGLEALSVYGRAHTDGGIGLLNTHVDLMDWHGARGGLPHEQLVAMLVRELQARADGDDEPIGILGHHLVHDETAWSFLSALIDETHDDPAVAWKGSDELIKN